MFFLFFFLAFVCVWACMTDFGDYEACGLDEMGCYSTIWNNKLVRNMLRQKNVAYIEICKIT